LLRVFAALDRWISAGLRFLAKYGDRGVEEELEVLALEERSRRRLRVLAARDWTARPPPPRSPSVARPRPGLSLGEWLLVLWAVVTAYSLAHFVLFWFGIVSE
jgi:hypothetical protein